jgi:hypothetical protein
MSTALDFFSTMTKVAGKSNRPEHCGESAES